MPEWMTSLFRDDVSDPTQVGRASSTITERPVAASARAADEADDARADHNCVDIAHAGSRLLAAVLSGEHIRLPFKRHAMAQFVAAEGAAVSRTRGML